MAPDEKRGKYLYAIVPAEAVDKLKLEANGVFGSEIYPLVFGKLAVVASDVEKGELRPERKNLSAHSGVLREVMDQTHLLPVAFGVVAGSEREVQELLADHEAEMREQLDQVKGSVEMGLRGVLQVPDVFEFFVQRYADLRKMRDETFANGEPSREEKIELGQYFAELLESYHDECVDKVVTGLGSVVKKCRSNETRNEEEVLNLAVLVARDQIDSFTRAVEALAPSLDEEIELRVTGPWPPYNFVDLRIKKVEEEEAEEAR